MTAICRLLGTCRRFRPTWCLVLHARSVSVSLSGDGGDSSSVATIAILGGRGVCLVTNETCHLVPSGALLSNGQSAVRFDWSMLVGCFLGLRRTLGDSEPHASWPEDSQAGANIFGWLGARSENVYGTSSTRRQLPSIFLRTGDSRWLQCLRSRVLEGTPRVDSQLESTEREHSLRFAEDHPIVGFAITIAPVFVRGDILVNAVNLGKRAAYGLAHSADVVGGAGSSRCWILMFSRIGLAKGYLGTDTALIRPARTAEDKNGNSIRLEFVYRHVPRTLIDRPKAGFPRCQLPGGFEGR